MTYLDLCEVLLGREVNVNSVIEKTDAFLSTLKVDTDSFNKLKIENTIPRLLTVATLEECQDWNAIRNALF